VTGATLMAIAAIASGAAGSDPRPQTADERRDSADHHHDADAARDQQLIPSPRSLTLGLAIVTIERVVQHRELLAVMESDAQGQAWAAE
jgi:hypothetical protein